ncbi:MAG: DNA polymerase IV [Planctomycetota bacterium]|nr:DNA polymerase IV [Planctomycetota bacterium]
MSERVMHIDMDAFFASVEQQVNPALRGKPVIIGGRNYKYRSIICAASYEAKRRGITNAMPSWKALKICPEAIFVPADTSKYIYTSNRIFEMLKTFSPQVEKFSVDEFFLDVDGCGRLFGGPACMGRRIKERIKAEFGITCTVGVAPTRTTAKLAAKMHKPDGLAVMTKPEVLAAMKEMPVEKICGIGGRLKRRLNLLGIETCGDFADFPTDVLKKHFGVVGVWLKIMCVAGDVSEISYYAGREEPPKSVGHSQTLRRASDDQEYIHNWIYLLSDMVAARLRRKGLAGRTVYFYIADGYGGGFGRQRTYAEPTHDGYTIYQHCLDIAASLGLQCLVARLLAVSVSNLMPADRNYLFPDDKKRDRLLGSMDAINAKFGDWTVYTASLRNASYETRKG